MKQPTPSVTDPGQRAIAAAVLCALVVIVFDLTVPEVNFSTLFLFLPLVGATAAGPKPTAVLGGAALVLGAAFLVIDERGLTESVVLMAGLTIGASIAVGLASARTSREQRLEDLDRFATIAQELIIRPVPKRLGNVAAAGRYVSASKVVAVGGDLYDVALTPAGVRFIIGDACGKGLGGIQLASSVLARFRESVFAEPDLRELAVQLDEHVIEVCARQGRELDYVTAVIGALGDGGELTVVSCGHPDGVLLRPSEMLVLQPTGRTTPLGLGARPVPEHFKVNVGERAVWWTDGASEARDESGTFFDVEGAVRALPYELPLAELLDDLVAGLEEHANGDVRDDVAFLALELTVPVPAGSWPRVGRAER